MKIRLTAFFYLFFVIICLQCSPEKTLESITVETDKNGQLQVQVTAEHVQQFKDKGFLTYTDFGAAGDGKTDDIDAIAAAHKIANELGLPVKAENNATYYIGGTTRSAIIKTNTDFGAAEFIIDDRKLEDRTSAVFRVESGKEPFNLEGITTLKRNQEKINHSLPGTCLVTVTNTDVKHYIRYGLNQNNGSSQTDIFVVDKNGNIDMDAPIIWDFDRITEIKALPIDAEVLQITGGKFTTIANQAESKYNYHSRNIAIRRSNVIVDGLEHHVTGEGEYGAPYGGFINTSECAYVSIKNCLFTGHKTYQTIGNAGKPVSMGTYDISLGRSISIKFINCSQTNDINDRTYWGLMGSNYCKNLVLVNCSFSRFDAHKGVANASIRNCELGHMGINAIGTGTFTVENSTIRGRSLINLRSDYGSTWEGEFIIRDCIFIPNTGESGKVNLINGFYSGQHNFGYTCYMPEKITIENLVIDDSNYTGEYKGPAIFANFNPENTSDSYVELYPYVKTKVLKLKNVNVHSGKKFRLSDNEYMFNEVRLVEE
ncbi:hypothetical protein [uncultured Draconibacterium sp.]|uniref:hypothetical protein n=1 Tax=uncultured Draconibacterium sp. TaxID=1573823 RepID=UPI0025FC9F44|nr:hypothetical protein [uncultured Draconibacterium sp.]